MADMPDVKYTAPPSPKKDLPAGPAAKSLTAVATPRLQRSERFTVRDLSEETSGPISNEIGVTRDLQRQVDVRNERARKRQIRTDWDMSRPYTTGRKVSR